MTVAADADHAGLAPERVFALVVGIESYGVGADWNLRGPARDAVRFAEWLTGPAGVPPGNVRLFLSPLPAPPVVPPRPRPTPQSYARRVGAAEAGPDGAPPRPCPGTPGPPSANGGQPRAALPGPVRLPAARPATSREIEDALLRELPACDGDLLLIYWAGHGYAGDHDQLLLPFADASAPPIRHLDLDSVLRFWRSSKVHQRFRRVVSIGDACRLDVRSGVRSTFGRVDYGTGRPVRGRRTFVLYAAQPGLPAQNLDGGGRLTDTLLARLAGRSLDDSLRHLPDIAREVHADLAALADRGQAWQQIQWRISDWDGNPVLDDGWPDEPAGAPRLDDQAWAELDRLLPGPGLPPDAYRAYRWAFEAAGCAPPGPVLPAAEPMAVVRDLDHRLGSADRRLPLPLAFVRYLAAREADPVRAERLADWVRRTGGRLGAEAVPAPPAPERDGRAELHVELTESSDEDAYLARIWLHRRGFEALWESGRPLPLRAVRAELLRQLFGPAVGPDLRRIEFHVPEPLLEEEFERWPLPTRGRRSAELGSAYEVLVRCPDERTHQSGRRWRRKWAWYREHGGRHPDAVHALTEGSALDPGLADRLGAEGHPVCALLDRHAAPVAERLELVLDAGLPIAVWRRTGGARPAACARPAGRTADRPEDRPADLPGCPAESGLAVLLAPGAGPGDAPGDDGNGLDLDRLPAAVWKLRIGAAAGSCAGCPGARRLGLLWDDPDHRPQTRSLS
ncbi:caspase family protein [Kitasatospora sp. A2-31]|uniref:VMAP-C domain-containing protein n=2 Tax=Kitasatospora sp. A2-31 TaxID=2916414 RepID=UPI001EEAA718|nr:caspase family protein [Kitasatospora sp. A2-31]MCG6493844.1 caspase family protein [Kitasatospora sp. A2-31]